MLMSKAETYLPKKISTVSHAADKTNRNTYNTTTSNRTIGISTLLSAKMQVASSIKLRS